jgi:hypothetical protein
MVAASVVWLTTTALVSAQTPSSPVEFLDTGFENASPLWYETAADGSIQVFLVYDHERAAPNRAAGHIHFRVHAQPGTEFVLEFRNLDNVWNGKPGSVARELKALAVSDDGKVWRSVATESPEAGRVRLPITMTGPSLTIARVEPYRLSDLDRFLAAIKPHPLVEIATIGKTVEGRELEIVRVGNPQAPYRVFVRARAHPWESGGNWVVQGLIQRLLQGDAEAKAWLDTYCLYVLPMANKDGVARGRTRFNLRGKDLNRTMHVPADPDLSPENHALEQWLERMIAKGQRPHLAIEMHNDGSGLLHLSRPPVPDIDRHLARMATLEELLRKHTWFTEGSTKPSFSNSGTLGSGWVQRYGIDAAVHELNCNWIAGRQKAPLGKDWEDYGAGLAKVFHEYFVAVKL